MNIKFLGTAAAEGIPAVFCGCKTCVEARKRGGRNIRTRSQALIDDKILIDFNADTYMHCLNHNLDLTKVEHCLITHTHEDHLYLDELNNRRLEFCNLGNERPFKIYASLGAAKIINGFIHSVVMNPKGVLEVNAVKCYEPFSIDDYKVTALNALHSVTSFPVIYIIENPEGKVLFYAHDTNYFQDEVWEYLEKSKVRFDFVSLDCTEANCPQMGYIGHMNLNDCKKVKNRLLEMGNADKDTIFYLNHFSHNGVDVLYEEFSEIAEKDGFLVTYDGLSVDF